MAIGRGLGLPRLIADPDVRQNLEFLLDKVTKGGDASGFPESPWIPITPVAGVVTPDFRDSWANTVTVNANVTLAKPIGIAPGRSYVLRFIRSGAGPIVLGWNDTVYRWPEGGIPNLSEDDGARDYATFIAEDADTVVGVYVHDFLFTPRNGSGADPTSGGPIARAVHHPGSQTSSNTSSTSLVDVDAVNLAVTFTPPASGNVKIVLEGMARVVDFTGSLLTPQCIWGLREGTTPVGSDQIALYATHYFDGSDWFADTWQRTRVSIYLTGLSGEKALKWAHRVPNSQIGGSLVRGGTMGPAIMEVWAEP